KLIDGGAEHTFNTDIYAWNRFVRQDSDHFVPESRRGRSPHNKKRWWPVLGDDFVISFIPLKGYAIIDTVEFDTWYPWKFKQIYVLEHMSRRVEFPCL
ncbi:MAG: hypothetical protein K8F91_10850, partial [Candidatus Obscuribacterales bacterium]|nr:hypothetical protein [Candidatus Obscuribacterales bacterium]